MEIIGYHADTDIICDSDGNCCTKPDNIPFDKLAEYWLDFLLQPKPNTIKVLYHLNYSTAKLCRMLQIGPESGLKLFRTGKLDLRPENYQLGYFSDKYLSIRCGRGNSALFTSFANMHQYHKEGLHEEVPTVESTVQKAKRAQEVAVSVYNALRAISIAPTTLTSPVRAYEKALLSQLDLPTIDDLPDGTAELAYQCLHGGWMEAFAVGHWPSAFDYDIKSAYGFQLSQLLDTRLGFWAELDQIPPDANIGFLQGQVTIWADFSPILYEVDADKTYTPKGTWDTVITLDEYRFILRWDLGTFKLDKGWFWIPERKSKPLHYIIKHLNGVKESMTGLERDVIKRTMVGIWGHQGLILQKNGEQEFSPTFNPVWASLVESRARLQVAEFCLQAMKLGARPLHIAVDGVILDSAVPSGWLGTSMGSWCLNAHGKCLVISSGIAGIEGKGSGGNDFTISYDRLCGLILGDLQAEEYSMVKDSYISLGRACQEHSWHLLGDVTPLNRAINITDENKRYYNPAPSCGGDILNSKFFGKPWPVEILDLELPV